MDNSLALSKFGKVDLSNPFFDSLKADYAEFATWFQKKANEQAYVYFASPTRIHGFLYVKVETDALADVSPPREAARRLKIGTFKIDAHGTRLGERFLKKAFDHAIEAEVEEIYVTVFPKHTGLIELLSRYGFEQQGTKTTNNGVEFLLVRKLFAASGDVTKDYPLIPLQGARHYLLALYPQWHSRLLPDSLLKTESASIIEDVSHTNSIHKIYLAAMRGVEGLKRGDTVVIYRTSDGAGPAHYRSVATTIAVIEDCRHLSTFESLDSFLDYASSYSIFSLDELIDFWKRKKYPWVMRFTYNLALKKRLTRQVLLEEIGLQSEYWGFFEIHRNQFLHLLRTAGHDASPLLN